jgi:hypothetical protein
MNSTDLPPIPRAGEHGPQVCNTVRLYLAVLDDLSPEQVNLLLKHVSACAFCTTEFHLMNRATRLVAGLAATTPSPRVDSAIMAVQSAQNGAQLRKPVRLHLPHRPAAWLPIQVAAAAIIMLAVLTATYFISTAPGVPKAFDLPANLSWSGYVLYHSETRTAPDGMLYRVESYHDLGSNRMHIETIADGKLDVVVVGDEQAMLGKDMLHHVAQWGADAWTVDDSLFDLADLRHALQTKAAVYLDEENFEGQDVYRIRCGSDLVLLLDMNYLPVNVLRDAGGPSTGKPMYDTLKLLPASEMPSSMWDMSIPAGFQMGILPAKP